MLNNFIHSQKPPDLKTPDQKHIAINFAMIYQPYKKEERQVLDMQVNMILPNNI